MIFYCRYGFVKSKGKYYFIIKRINITIVNFIGKEKVFIRITINNFILSTYKKCMQIT